MYLFYHIWSPCSLYLSREMLHLSKRPKSIVNGLIEFLARSTRVPCTFTLECCSPKRQRSDCNEESLHPCDIQSYKVAYSTASCQWPRFFRTAPCRLNRQPPRLPTSLKICKIRYGILLLRSRPHCTNPSREFFRYMIVVRIG